jgi:hypothetical protein
MVDGMYMQRPSDECMQVLALASAKIPACVTVATDATMMLSTLDWAPGRGTMGGVLPDVSRLEQPAEAHDGAAGHRADGEAPRRSHRRVSVRVLVSRHKPVHVERAQRQPPRRRQLPRRSKSPADSQGSGVDPSCARRPRGTRVWQVKSLCTYIPDDI